MRFNWFKKKPSVEKTSPEGVLNKYDLASLKEALKYGDEQTRISAAQTIGRIYGKNAIYPLTEAFKDTSSKVRQYAAESLGNIEYGRDSSGRLDSRDVFNALKSLLKDVDSDVRRAVEEAREKIVEKNPSLKPEDVKGKRIVNFQAKRWLLLGSTRLHGQKTILRARLKRKLLTLQSVRYVVRNVLRKK